MGGKNYCYTTNISIQLSRISNLSIVIKLPVLDKLFTYSFEGNFITQDQHIKTTIKNKFVKFEFELCKN